MLINPKSSVRTMLYDEQTFLYLDVGRTILMAIILFAPLGLPFATLSSLVSCGLYLGYYLFIRWRVRVKFSTSPPNNG